MWPIEMFTRWYRLPRATCVFKNRQRDPFRLFVPTSRRVLNRIARQSAPTPFRRRAPNRLVPRNGRLQLVRLQFALNQRGPQPLVLKLRVRPNGPLLPVRRQKSVLLRVPPPIPLRQSQLPTSQPRLSPSAKTNIRSSFADQLSTL